jgi:hypothetical protein
VISSGRATRPVLDSVALTQPHAGWDLPVGTVVTSSGEVTGFLTGRR